ncbi:MAG: peroxiredoxin [Nitrososphaerota archaeon]|nr:peroxiredoxin [Nitrososphaerota archaeon]MDG6966609.1 peroxiredoxin [Nitrososphaerota archaeon]MDG6978532.1 peroxiredoxin [Nitrososphaerota archaeon]MDG7021086.1 peroxiredoxin [Nitrososphaerota archaeon]MDG7022013.1 peroxiredoxin [Nitrososphaerota archaeon]
MKVGDRAPEFSLASQDGSTVRLGELLERGSVVLYFYPKDKTPGCTAEAGAFRQSYREIRALGAEVVGVSSDSVDSHKDFATECDLPFKLASDPNGELRKKYGVPSSLGLLPGRVTYVIDSEGVVRHIFSSQFQPTRHVKEALKALGAAEGGTPATG